MPDNQETLAIASSPAFASDFRPSEYLIRVKPSRCTHCGSVQRISEVFLVWLSASKKSLRKLVPVQALHYNLEIGTTILNEAVTPACILCHDDEAMHLHLESQPSPITDEEWKRALDKKHRQVPDAPAAPAKRAPKPSKFTTSLDDL